MAERPLVRYRSLVFDSDRWRGFVFRPGDIVISTPPKCGTTWTQMICALLILQEPVLGTPLSLLSPWLDNVARARSDVVGDLDRQPHRRFIKTHTPLDGLPLDESVTYVCVGRDPRDVALSMDNHWDNLDIAAFLVAREAAAKVDGVELGPVGKPPPRPDSPHERFWLWVDNPTPPTDSVASLQMTLHHLGTFWNAPESLDVVMLHYQDLQDDLEGQMRSLAGRLGIDVPDHRRPGLVAAARFEEMRRNADVTAPNASTGFWRENARFFHRGTSGQWRDLLDEDDLERYRRRVGEFADPELASWVHRPPLDG